MPNYREDHIFERAEIRLMSGEMTVYVSTRILREDGTEAAPTNQRSFNVSLSEVPELMAALKSLPVVKACRRATGSETSQIFLPSKAVTIVQPVNREELGAEEA